MSRKLTDAKRGEDTFIIDPANLIIVEGDNCRAFPPSRASLDDLKEQIYKEGQDQPCIGRPAADGKVILTRGYNRAAVVAEINAEIAAGTREGPMRGVLIYVRNENREESFLRNIKQNDTFNPLTAIDQAKNIRRLSNEPYSMDTAAIADFYHRSPAWVVQHLKLTNLCMDIQRLVHEGVISTADAFKVASLPEDEQHDAINAALVPATPQTTAQTTSTDDNSSPFDTTGDPAPITITDTSDGPVSDAKVFTAAPVQIDSTKLKKNIADKKRKAGKKGAQLTVKHIKTFWEMLGPGSEGKDEKSGKPLGRQVSVLKTNTLDWISGKMDDDAYERRLQNLNK